MANLFEQQQLYPAKKACRWPITALRSDRQHCWRLTMLRHEFIFVHLENEITCRSSKGRNIVGSQEKRHPLRPGCTFVAADSGTMSITTIRVLIAPLHLLSFARYDPGLTLPRLQTLCCLTAVNVLAELYGGSGNLLELTKRRPTHRRSKPQLGPATEWGHGLIAAMPIRIASVACEPCHPR